MISRIGEWSRHSWEWFREKSRDRRAAWWLALYSFFDPTILPIPFDPFLALLSMANRVKAVFFILVSSFFATLGALCGYLLAAFLYGVAVVPVARSLGFLESIESIAEAANSFTFIALFLTALTPISDPPFVFGAGLLRVDVVVFLSAFFLGRTLRSTIVVVFALFFGERIIRFLEEQENSRIWGFLSIALLVTIIGTVILSLFIAQ